mmetsp:Transcript_29201/g.83823  ORF Transcript_29201/g.83823 Transcript_29201/m.83823 type:complete len:289 (+) Transcript_29201:407-1273(+)
MAPPVAGCALSAMALASGRLHLAVECNMAPPRDPPRLDARGGSDPLHDPVDLVDQYALHQGVQPAGDQPLATLLDPFLVELQPSGQPAVCLRLDAVPRADLHEDAAVGFADLVIDSVLHRLQIPIAFMRQDDGALRHLIKEVAKLFNRDMWRAAAPRRHWTAVACVIPDHHCHHLPHCPGHCEHHIGALCEWHLDVARPPTIWRPCLMKPYVKRIAILSSDARQDAVALDRRSEALHIDHQQLALTGSARGAYVQPLRPQSALAEQAALADRGRSLLHHRRGQGVPAV